MKHKINREEVYTIITFGILLITFIAYLVEKDNDKNSEVDTSKPILSSPIDSGKVDFDFSNLK